MCIVDSNAGGGGLDERERAAGGVSEASERQEMHQNHLSYPIVVNTGYQVTQPLLELLIRKIAYRLISAEPIRVVEAQYLGVFLGLQQWKLTTRSKKQM
jgi:hypothetical protein